MLHRMERGAQQAAVASVPCCCQLRRSVFLSITFLAKSIFHYHIWKHHLKNVSRTLQVVAFSVPRTYIIATREFSTFFEFSQ